VIDWQERITRDTGEAIRVEHRVRYAVAAPIIADAPLWADLGCGNGIAAAEALGGRLPGRILLVDASQDVLPQAAREFATDALTTLEADLSSPADLKRVREALGAAHGEGGCLTAFEVVEHLADFAPLVELLVELAEEGGFTSVLSVPNDAFWAIENPYHLTKWGEGAFEELRRLLPESHVVARQHALQGSVAVVEDSDAEARTVSIEPIPEPVATHFLVAFGPAARRIGGAAEVAEADLLEQRRWERQRESDSAHLQATEQWLRSELEDWRGYIHELERRLGLPLSGKQDPE
jgi:SAM-dependent methyltransferase